MMKRILVEPKNSAIAQYKELLRVDKVELSFDQDALDFVATSAVEHQTGARGLRAVLVRKI